MSRYIDQARDRFGVGPICRAMGWNESTYWSRRKRQPCARALRDEMLVEDIRRVHASARDGVYGARKVWHHLRREGKTVARCTIERCMKANGLVGVKRGKRKRTTVPDASAPRPADLVDRAFVASRPNELWVADITYVRTWKGFCYVSMVIDVYSRLIVGWALTTHLRTDLALEALEMAIWRRSTTLDGLVHHSDRGSQYLAIRYTERLLDAGIEPSVGSRGDSYDNALAEAVMSLYKAEEIYRKGPWRTPDDVELATLSWIDWWNNERLHSSIDYRPPAEYEEVFYAQKGKVLVDR
jgi:putative transposase